MQQPKQIGRYQIIEEIGQGGMATVYRARDPKLNRDVALKIIVPQLSVDRKFVQRFQREARIVAKVDHPQIVSIFDSGEYEGRPYIVMRLLNQGTLRDIIDQGPLPVDRVLQIVAQISDALSTAHQKGIVHRDMKPSNILFDGRGNAYVSDFGIAKMIDSRTNLTGTHMVGTPVYMSPEQFQGGAIDGRTDQYSLGIVAYEALSGRPPFEGEMMTLAYKHVHEPIPALQEIANHVPPDLVEILNRSLSKRPGDRFPDMTLLRQAIMALPFYHPLMGSASARPTPSPRIVHQPKPFDASVTTTDPDAPTAIEDLYRKGIEALQQNRYTEARELLSRAFNLNPRYRDVGTKLHEAESILATQIRFGNAGTPPHKTPVTQDVTIPPPAREEKRSRWPIWAGVIGLLILLVGGGIFGFSNGWFGGDDPADVTNGGETIAEVVVDDPTEEPADLATETPPPPTDTPEVVEAAADPPTETPEPTATEAPTETPEPNEEPAVVEGDDPTETPEPSFTPTPTATATSSQATGPASSGDGLPLTFDGGAFGTWVRGDEENGTLTQASNQSRSGQSARLDYSFPGSSNDYVVFLQNNPVSGTPNQINVWVFGDGSGHFLNAWIRDNDGQTWQVPLGRITHTGWAQMTGQIETGQDWPWTHISGTNDEEVDYPITLRGFVLDDLSDSYSGSGTIYLDDVSVGTGSSTVASSGNESSGGSTESSETGGADPTATPESTTVFEGEVGRILYTSGSTLLTTDPTWSSPQEIGTAAQTSCSGTPSTVDGASFSVSRGFYCGLTEGTSVCQSPNGAVEVIFNGTYADGFALTIRAVGAEGGGDYIFDSKDFDLSEGLRWSPNSDSFMFVLGDTLYMGYTDRSYTPLFSPVYNPIFSPDGSQILYRRPIGPGVNDVFVANASGENQTNLTNISTVDKSCAVWVSP